MKYEVNEKKFFSIKDLEKVNGFNYDFNHIETTFDLEKYELMIELEYQNNNEEQYIKDIKYPIELVTNITESLSATLQKVEYQVKKNDGIEVEIFLEVEVSSFEEEKENIKEDYQHELKEILNNREVDASAFEVVESTDANLTIESTASGIFNIADMFKTEYAKYKVLTLEEKILDKISLEYNLSLEYLYEMKKHNNKVIVYVE